jgi:hypothetical protein
MPRSRYTGPSATLGNCERKASLMERAQTLGNQGRRLAAEEAYDRQPRLLRPRHHRPRRRAAEKRDEVTTAHDQPSWRSED